MNHGIGFFSRLFLCFLLTSGTSLNSTAKLTGSPVLPKWSVQSFKSLERWEADDLQDALINLRYVREQLRMRSPEEPLHTGDSQELYGTVRDWLLVLDKLPDPATPSPIIREFFENHFVPVRIGDRPGRLSGYCAPTYVGCLKATADYDTPLLRRPEIDLDRQLTRFQILHHESLKQTHALVWLRPLDAYFAQLHGVVNVIIKGGTPRKTLCFVYVDDNGHAYRSVLKQLSKSKHMAAEETCREDHIRRSIETHPAQKKYLETNPAYTFFGSSKKATGSSSLIGPSVVLTPGRSLAVDRRIYPPGIPIWIQSSLRISLLNAVVPLCRLAISQTTKPCIQGSQNAELYWDAGDTYGEGANATLTILIPKQILAASKKNQHNALP